MVVSASATAKLRVGGCEDLILDGPPWTTGCIDVDVGALTRAIEKLAAALDGEILARVELEAKVDAIGDKVGEAHKAADAFTTSLDKDVGGCHKVASDASEAFRGCGPEPDLKHVQQSIVRLEQGLLYHKRQQDQKACAVDESFRLQLNAMKRDINTRLPREEMSKQVDSLLSHVRPMVETQSKEAATAVAADEVSHLHASVEAVCASLGEQQRLLEERLEEILAVRCTPSSAAATPLIVVGDAAEQVDATDAQASPLPGQSHSCEQYSGTTEVDAAKCDRSRPLTPCSAMSTGPLGTEDECSVLCQDSCFGSRRASSVVSMGPESRGSSRQAGHRGVLDLSEMQEQLAEVRNQLAALAAQVAACAARERVSGGTENGGAVGEQDHSCADFGLSLDVLRCQLRHEMNKRFEELVAGLQRSGTAGEPGHHFGYTDGTAVGQNLVPVSAGAARSDGQECDAAGDAAGGPEGNKHFATCGRDAETEVTEGNPSSTEQEFIDRLWLRVQHDLDRRFGELPPGCWHGPPVGVSTEAPASLDSLPLRSLDREGNGAPPPRRLLGQKRAMRHNAPHSPAHACTCATPQTLTPATGANAAVPLGVQDQPRPVGTPSSLSEAQGHHGHGGPRANPRPLPMLKSVPDPPPFRQSTAPTTPGSEEEADVAVTGGLLVAKPVAAEIAQLRDEVAELRKQFKSDLDRRSETVSSCRWVEDSITNALGKPADPAEAADPDTGGASDPWCVEVYQWLQTQLDKIRRELNDGPTMGACATDAVPSCTTNTTHSPVAASHTPMSASASSVARRLEEVEAKVSLPREQLKRLETRLAVLETAEKPRVSLDAGKHNEGTLRDEMVKLDKRLGSLERLPGVLGLAAEGSKCSKRGPENGSGDWAGELANVFHAVRGVQRNADLTSAKVEDVVSGLASLKSKVEAALPQLFHILERLCTGSSDLADHNHHSTHDSHGLQVLQELIGSTDDPQRLQFLRDLIGSSAREDHESLQRAVEAMDANLRGQMCQLRNELLDRLGEKAGCDDLHTLFARQQGLEAHPILAQLYSEQTVEEPAVTRVPLLPARCISCDRKVELTGGKPHPCHGASPQWPKRESSCPIHHVAGPPPGYRQRREPSLPAIERHR